MEWNSKELKWISIVSMLVLVWDTFSTQGLSAILTILILALVVIGIVLLFKERSTLAGIYLVTGYSVATFFYGAHSLFIYSHWPSLASPYFMICCIAISGAVYAQQIFRAPTELSDNARKTSVVIFVIALLFILSIGFYPKISCGFRGGTYTTGGLSQTEYCLFKYADGGRPCSSSKECEEACILPEFTVPSDTPVMGICKTDSDPYGCYYYVEDGKVLGGVCTD